jgi:hypothetical protein
MRRFRNIEDLTGPQSRHSYRTPESRTVSRRTVRKGLRRGVVMALTVLRGRISRKG